METKLISITEPKIKGLTTAEELIVYAARVSNPKNQMNMETAPKLLRYLIENKHWSPFEMVNMCVSIKTSRAIAAQILRHRSFSFQEFSQRYAAVDSADKEYPELRAKTEINRQSSTAVSSKHLQDYAKEAIDIAFNAYEKLLSEGVATESARMVLPLCAPTKLYMNGTIRSWIHYLAQRCAPHAQLEHRLIADEIKDIFRLELPATFEAIYSE